MKTVLAVLGSVTLLPIPAPRAADFGAVSCEGTYTHHLQDVCAVADRLGLSRSGAKFRVQQGG